MTSDNPIDEIGALIGKMKSTISPFRMTLQSLHEDLKPIVEGVVADYIPELAKADPEWFGISIVTADGRSFQVGESQQHFSIQSISKPFVFGKALEDHGRDVVLNRVGVEPTGEAFNSIVLDEDSNRPFNPMVNAGAIATTDLIQGTDYPDRVGRMIDLFSKYIGRDVHIDNQVFMSERTTGHRNRAIGYLMRNFEMVNKDFEESLELYFQQCSILVNAHDLAVMGATLANSGVNPLTNQRAISAEYVKDVLSIMLTCGMYDYAGEWAYRVGLPAKSGVAGGIVAVVPGRLGIGIYSPRLDPKGNSVRGIKVCERLSNQFALHAFECQENSDKVSDQI